MPGNSDAPKSRQADLITKRAVEGKDFKTIGEEMKTSTATAWRDWESVKNDENIELLLTELKNKSLINAIDATDVEGTYLTQTKGKEGLSAQEAATASTIGVNNQKRYSTLQGDRTDDKGGDATPPELKAAVDALLGNM
jgi:hypothetical protein